MKFLSFFFAAALFVSSCDIRKDVPHKADTKDHSNLKTTDSTTVELLDSVYNFGKVADGEKVEYNFRFRNSGQKPLVVESTSASCGCTVPEKPEEPILPGQIGTIKVVFNSAGRVGTVVKEINVASNARPEFPVLQLAGEVVNKQ